MFSRRWFDQTPLRFRFLFWREQADRELDEELQYHLNRATQRNIDRGMTAAEAHRAALLDLGGFEQVKEECRDARGLRFMDELYRDIRFGARMMRKAPAFTFVAVATLALAIGANTTVLGLVNALLIRPLSFPDAKELVLLWEQFPAQQLEAVPFSAPEFRELEKENRSFDNVAAFTHTEFNLVGLGTPERVQGSNVTPNLFFVLKTAPLLGRVFQPNESNAVVISERLWRRLSHSDPAMVGTRLSLNGRFYPVVGVMPANFKFPFPLFNIRGQFAGSADIWKAIAFSPEEMADRGRRIYGAIGRLGRGVTVREANTELEKLTNDWRRRYSDVYSKGGFALNAYELREYLVGHMRALLFVLQGAVFLLLLIAAANLAAMLLARAGVRQQETAIRMALGAGRLRIVRQSLTEAISMTVLAGGLGLALGWFGLFLLRFFGAQTVPRLAEANLDKNIVLVVLLLSAITGILPGLVPVAKRDWNSSVAHALKEGARGSTRASRRLRLRNLFIIVESALAIVLLIGAGSFIKSFNHLRTADRGFNSEDVMTMETSLPAVNYPTTEKVADFFARAEQRIASLPGVTSAAFTSLLPLSGSNRDVSFSIEGRNANPFAPTPDEEMRIVTPDYFRVLEIPLLEGRFLLAADTADSPPVVIINQALAQRYWPAGDCLGKRISLNGRESGKKWRIVGIVANFRHRGLDERPRPEFYLPLAQHPCAAMVLVIRSSRPASELISAVRKEVFSIDPLQPVAIIRSLDRVVADSIASRRITVVLAGIFAASAALFASIGIYGVMSALVLERKQEIAVRMAFGARSRHIFLRSLIPGVRLLLPGATIGILIVLVSTHVWRHAFHDLATFDSGTIFGAVSILGCLCFLAMYLPARRATREDLLIALREN